MADDGDDFDFDEDGIYRERGLDTDQGFLDEDGIWRDDTDLSHQTLRTDSGFGTADRRSSNSTLNKIPISVFDRNDGDHLDIHGDDDDDEVDFDDDGEDGAYHNDSYHVVEKSLNISDLEASASIAGGYAFDEASLDSNDEVNLPELNSRFLASSEDRTNSDADVGDLNDFTDFEGNDSRESTGFFLNTGHGDGPSFTKTKELSYTSGAELHSQPRDRLYSHSDSHEYDHDSRYSQQSMPHRYSQEAPRGRSSQSMAEYLLSGGGDSYYNSDHLEEMRDKVGQLYSRPGVVGDSLFTQEDQEVLPYHNRHSLLEFEQLEAALHGHHEAESDHSGEHMDLIGAYLQGLQNQEDEEEQERRRRYSSIRHQNSSSAKRLGAHEEFGEGDEAEEYQGPQSRKSSVNSIPFHQDTDQHASDRYDAEESDGTLDNSLEEEETSRHRRITRSDAIDRGHLEEIERQRCLRESERMEERLQRQRSSFQNQKSDSGDRQSTLQSSFEESIRLLGTQQPPFDSVTFTTLEMSGGTNETGHRQATMSETNSSRQTKIPMLRSRSPSMTRPGSTSPAGSSPQTPERYGSNSQDRVRSLPPTPERITHNSTHQNFPNRTLSSRSPLYERSFSRGDSVDSGAEKQSRPTSEEENELDKAASLLVGDTDPVETMLVSSAKTLHGVRSVQSAQVTDTSKEKGKLRPSSAGLQEASVRSSLRNARVRSAGSGATRTQPAMVTTMRVSRDDSEINSKKKEKSDDYTQEAQQRQLNEETLQQLHQDYNSLLQKYAQAENTIDSLRIGAVIPISVELTTTGGTANPVLPTGGQPTKAPHGGGSLNNSMTSMQVPVPDSRSPEYLSRKSTSGQQSGQDNGHQGQGTDRLSADFMASMKGESAKLSLFAKAKSVDEKTQALMILLNENCLSTDDQVQALQNIKDGYEELQQQYRDTKADHNLQVRRGVLPNQTPAFDVDKAVEGELYKLGMKMDDLEHHVQENVKVKSSTRIPFKADHTINVASMGGKVDSTTTPLELPPNRPSSVGSFAGGPDDMDEQIHRLNKDYNHLMDRYRRLKQLKMTPERDNEVDSLLTKLRRIYEQTPEHRRPALPPELEKHYNPVNGHFLSSESEAPLRRSSLDLYRRRSQGQESDSLPGLNNSDLSIGRHSTGRHDDPKVSSDYMSSATDSTTRQRRQKRLPNRMPQNGRNYKSYDSVTSSPSRKSESSSRQDRLPVFHGNKRREREDKDSGYVGSEASRKTANQVTDKDRLRQASQAGVRHGNRLPTKVAIDPSQGQADRSDFSESTSDLSTVEHVRPYRPGANTRGGAAGKKATPGAQGDVSVAVPGKGKGRLKAGGASSDPTLNRHKGHGSSRSLPSHGEMMTDTDSESQASSKTSKSRLSVKSEQIQTLEDEITKLKKEMWNRDKQPPAAAAAPSTTPSQPLQQQPAAGQMPVTQPGTQYALLYGYPPGETHPSYGSHGTQIPTLDTQEVLPSQGHARYAHQPTYPVPSVATAPGNHSNPQQEQYGGPDTQYREFQEPAHHEVWEPVQGTREHRDRFRDFDDVDRSGCHSDGGDRQPHERERKRTRERERKQRLRDYYIPSRTWTDLPEHDRYGGAHEHSRHARHYDPYRHGYDNTHGYSSDPRQQGYVSGGVSTAVPAAVVGGVPPLPAYQQVHPGPCSTCGGSGYHSHGDYIHQPAGGATVQPLVNPQPQSAPGYVMVPANVPPTAVPNTGQTYVAATPSPTVPSATTYIPVQLVTQTSPSKVRYYVREYNTEADTVKPLRRSYSLGNLARTTRHVKHMYMEGGNSDSENEDLNSSLTSALQTAGRIKKMSRRMKKTLRSELDLRVGAC